MCHDCILVTNICVPYTHINTLHLTNNNNTACRPCKGHQCDHFFGAPCAPLLLPLHAPLWRSGPHLRRRRNFSRSPRGERRDPPQHTAVPRSTRSDRAVPLSLWLSLFASLRAALRELLSIRDARAPVEQVGRSLPGSLEERTNQQCCSSSQEPSFLVFLFFSPAPSRRRRL